MIDLGPEAQQEFHDRPFHRRYRVVIFFSIFALLLFTRLWDLGMKTMMHDELLFADYSNRGLYRNWSYLYQPILHGPAMLHLQNLVWHVFGQSDYTVRLGCALLGIFGFFWIWKMRYWLGEVGTWVALLFYTLSPGIMYYQRFFRNDALFLFTSLWIIASFANWWRTRDGRWGASAIAGCAVLFANKESSLFIYFSIITFFLIMAIHDLTAWVLEGKRSDVRSHLDRLPRIPNPLWPTMILGVFVVLCLVYIFEGLRYDGEVRRAIGHDWTLRDVRSIPIMLGWQSPTPESAPDAGGVISRQFWLMFYGGLFAGLLGVFAIFKTAAQRHLGHSEFLTRFWQLVYQSRWYLIGALGLSVAIYLAVFTTFLKHKIGFFEIYSRTWAYWGGQHEWGRIGGPFHQHPLNMVIYELPAVLAVSAAWIYGLFRVRVSRSMGVAFVLMAVPVAAFHALIFSGLGVQAAGGAGIEPANVQFLKTIFFITLALGALIIVFPRWGRAIIPASIAALIVGFQFILNTAWWRELMDSPIYRDGDPVNLMNRHVNFRDFIEITFNFDGGWNILLVLVLVFFATLYAWNAIHKGERFHGFLVWWFVTSLGAACYAREAVPQIGIHAMLPLILLAGSYTQKLFVAFPRVRTMPFTYIVIGIFAAWNAKASFVLNFTYPDDPRERMVYGPNHRDVKNHIDFIRDYHKIAGLRLDERGVPVFLGSPNDFRRHKDVRIFMRSIDGFSWPAKWYLRDIEYSEGANPATAIEQRWHFLILHPDDLERFPEVREHYIVQRGRGTVFWTPDPIATNSLVNVWKNMIPGHYLDRSPQAGEALQAREDWYTVWRYLLMREIFDGTDRPWPSMSSLQDYYFCYRKDLF